MLDDRQCLLRISAEPEVLDAIASSVAARVPRDDESADQTLLPFDAESDEVAALVAETRWDNKQLSFRVHAPLEEDSLAARRERWGSDSDAQQSRLIERLSGERKLVYGFRVAGKPPLSWLEALVTAFPTSSVFLTVADVESRTFECFVAKLGADGGVKVIGGAQEMADDLAEALSDPELDMAATFSDWP